MTNKPLILLGVATALALAGAQVNAQTACPTVPTVISTLISSNTSSFSCTIGDKIFSNFSFPTNNLSQIIRNDVVFETAGSDTSVVFERGPGFPNGLNTFDFTVTIDPAGLAAGTTIIQHTFNAVAGTDSGGMIMGNNSGSHTIADASNPRTNVLMLSPADTSVMVDVHASQTGSSTALASVTNIFGQSAAPPAPVPEPMSLSLFGLGLAGLALARRRRS